ncbi:FUSC family protein [Virgibacillus halophilus]|uniref:FUSC family protein n=1 Tax=Tigheibacillus halophilus TaxID=361280 RepID=A0ABU5C919_9BACI|nr:FUSC family protein [Virgibacillus halophilus]
MDCLRRWGGLTAAYTNNEPYAQRAVRLFLILIGLSVSMGLGILSGSSLWLTTFTIAGVSTLAFFLCETWRVPKPSGFLFTLVCAVGTGLPIPVSSALSSSGLVALGGCWAWVLSMSGCIVKPRGPENTAVENAYKEVAGFLSAIGSFEADYKERNATVALRTAQEVVQAAEIRRLPRTGKTARLQQLTYRANALFLAGVELSAEESGKLVDELASTVRYLADAISDPKKAQSIHVPRPAKETAARKRVFRELSTAVCVAAADKYESEQRIQLRKQTFLDTFMGAFNRDSLVLPTTFRIGISLVAATLIAAAFGTERPYWVPLTCAAVLNGTTPVTIFHRSIQRAAGTAVGIFIGAGLVALQSSPFIIAFAIMALQFCIQFTITRNYGFGVTFITPLALLMAESGRSGVTADSLISTRLLDTITGCIIGVIGGTFVMAACLLH